MPELPEVETIRNSLAPLIGKRVEKLAFSPLAPIETTTPAKIQRALTGTIITAIRRWGKYLLFDTNQNAKLVIHLGMTGRLLLNPDPTKHVHITVVFQDRSRLSLIDPRRFGTISLSCKPDGSDNRFLQRLGPDYLNPKLTPEIFVQRCRKHPGVSLKSLLLNQGIAAGLGNIYACEALYRAGLSPKRRVRRTTGEELSRLLSSVRQVSALGIRHGGTTLRDYRNGAGEPGRMKELLQVYGRAGELTADRRGLVTRIVQGQRSTFYAPSLQK